MTQTEQLSERDLVEMYRWLVRIRAFEDWVCDSWSQGKLVEPPHGSQGQEAIAVGACFGLRQGDWALPSLRTRGAFLVRGVPARVQLAGMHARKMAIMFVAQTARNRKHKMKNSVGKSTPRSQLANAMNGMTALKNSRVM